MSETPDEYYETVLDSNGFPTARIDMNKAMRDGMELAGNAISARTDMQSVFSLMNNSAAEQDHASNVVAGYAVVRLAYVVDTLVGALNACGVPESQINAILYEK